MITDYIYGNEDGSSLVSSLKDLSDFDALLQWSQKDWQSLLNRIFVDNKPIIVTAKPSALMYEQLEKEKSDLIKQREAEFDDEKKLVLLKRLNNAKILMIGQFRNLYYRNLRLIILQRVLNLSTRKALQLSIRINTIMLVIR